MSQVDSNIPLRLQRPEFMSPAQAISLQSMVQQMQAQKLQQTQALSTMAKQAQIQQRLSQPDAVDPTSGLFTNVALSDITRMDASTGIHLTGQVQHVKDEQAAAQSRMLADQANKLKLTEHLKESQNEVLEAAVSFVDANMKTASPEAKDAKVREKVMEGLDRQERGGGYPYTQEQWQNLRKYPYSYNDAKARVTPPKEVAAQQTKEDKAAFASEQATAKADLATKRLQLETERLQMQKDRDAKKAEGESGRAAVFTNRMITSANEAMRGLENVVKLPASTTRGLLGGREQGPSLLQATKETLANNVTTEEAQLYNVMTAGIQRNLASIEAVGLMPSGALTHMMDNVIIKEGDTQLTKASKLAEIRQILEAGMEPILANPKVPKELKDLVTNIQNRVAKAVPFTQDDVISLMGSPDSDKTLGSIVKGQRKDQDSGAVIKPYGDVEKEKRYQDWKKKNGY